jgi:hypothetical protein
MHGALKPRYQISLSLQKDILTFNSSDSLGISRHRSPRFAATMVDQSAPGARPKCTPAELMLKVILAGTLSHYENRGMIDDKRLEHMLSAGKQVLYKSHQESEVRCVLQASHGLIRFWANSLCVDKALGCRRRYGKASQMFWPKQSPFSSLNPSLGRVRLRQITTIPRRI